MVKSILNKNMETIKDIVVIDGFLTSAQCQRFIDLGAQYPRKHSGIQENLHRHWKHVSDIVSPDGSELQNMLQQLHSDVGAKIEEIYKSPAKPRDVGYFYEYGMGDYYRPHVDSQTVVTQEGMTIAVRKVTSSDVSSIVYLNDGFVGGEIDFIFANNAVRPKPGRLVLFYGGWENLHGVRPIEVGKRYCVVNWYRTEETIVPNMEEIPQPYADHFAQLQAAFRSN
jgi:predicted 2-oxoglutarate/Fe(II)-dependent dioxygenase YbiX